MTKKQHKNIILLPFTSATPHISAFSKLNMLIPMKITPRRSVYEYFFLFVFFTVNSHSSSLKPTQKKKNAGVIQPATVTN